MKTDFKYKKEDRKLTPLTVKLKSNWRFESGISTMVSDTPFLCSIQPRPEVGVCSSETLFLHSGKGPATNSTPIKLNESAKMTNKTRNIWWIVWLQRSSTKANILRTMRENYRQILFYTHAHHIILVTMDDYTTAGSVSLGNMHSRCWHLMKFTDGLGDIGKPASQLSTALPKRNSLTGVYYNVPKISDTSLSIYRWEREQCAMWKIETRQLALSSFIPRCLGNAPTPPGNDLHDTGWKVRQLERLKAKCALRVKTQV